MPEKIPANEITFREMSEEQAVKTFEDDGYFDYQKRTMRYGKNLPPDSLWAKAPATMFVAYYNNKPVAVIGFAKYKRFLLDAGVHVREEFRGRGLGSILLDKIISEKGNKTLLVNIANPQISGSFRRKGFKDMEMDKLPQELRDEFEGTNYPDQVQKWMQHFNPEWMEVLKWN